MKAQNDVPWNYQYEAQNNRYDSDSDTDQEQCELSGASLLVASTQSSSALPTPVYPPLQPSPNPASPVSTPTHNLSTSVISEQEISIDEQFQLNIMKTKDNVDTEYASTWSYRKTASPSPSDIVSSGNLRVLGHGTLLLGTLLPEGACLDKY